MTMFTAETQRRREKPEEKTSQRALPVLERPRGWGAEIAESAEARRPRLLAQGCRLFSSLRLSVSAVNNGFSRHSIARELQPIRLTLIPSASSALSMLAFLFPLRLCVSAVNNRFSRHSITGEPQPIRGTLISSALSALSMLAFLFPLRLCASAVNNRFSRHSISRELQPIRGTLISSASSAPSMPALLFPLRLCASAVNTHVS
jgi:hypothetical protein